MAVSLVAYAYFSRLNYSRWFGLIVCSAIVILVTSVIGYAMKGALVETECDAGMLLAICGEILYDSSKLLEQAEIKLQFRTLPISMLTCSVSLSPCLTYFRVW